MPSHLYLHMHLATYIGLDSNTHITKGLANTKKIIAANATVELIMSLRYERNQSDRPILTSKLRKPRPYQANTPSQRIRIITASSSENCYVFSFIFSMCNFKFLPLI